MRAFKIKRSRENIAKMERMHTRPPSLALLAYASICLRLLQTKKQTKHELFSRGLKVICSQVSQAKYHHLDCAIAESFQHQMIKERQSSKKGEETGHGMNSGYFHGVQGRLFLEVLR